MKDKTLFVVSGFMRTGTSMMVKALESGGLEASFRKSRDEMKDKYKDEFYDPNKGGLYELKREDYLKPDFPRGYEGKLIKALSMSVPRMNVMPNGIRVVFMRRDSEEIKQSYDAFFGNQLKRGWDNFDKSMESIIERINNRKDVLSCTVLWYRDVINNPQKAFETLKKDGWPIDVSKSVGVVDKDLIHFKKEELNPDAML